MANNRSILLEKVIKLDKMPKLKKIEVDYERIDNASLFSEGLLTKLKKRGIEIKDELGRVI